ncbi:MAG: beta strand repeat-containing protein [Roseimicrobium sp.]
MVTVPSFAYVFIRDGTTWSRQSAFSPPGNNNFAFSASLENGNAILGGSSSVVYSTSGVENPAPEIAIEQPAGSSNGISTGGLRDFGTVNLGESNELTFTLKNTGSMALQLTGTPAVAVTGSPDFTVAEQPATTVASTSGSTTFKVRFAPSSAGLKSASLSILNNDANESPFTISLTGNGNAVPVITSNGGGAAASINVQENGTTVTTVTAADANVPATQTLVFAKSGADANLFTLDTATGALVFATAPNFEAPTDADGNNVYEVTVTVTDTVGTSDSQALSINVLNVNEAPSIADISNMNTLEDADTGFVHFAVNDPDANTTFALSGTSSNTALVPNGNITFGGSGNARTVKVTPAADKNGTATITVTVSDGALTASDTFTVTVTPVNDAPSFALPAGAPYILSAATGSPLITMPGFASGILAGPTDEAAQTVSFTVTNTNDALFATEPSIAPNGTLIFAPTDVASGTATVTVTATDSGGVAHGGADTSTAKTFVIHVTAPELVVEQTPGTELTSGFGVSFSERVGVGSSTPPQTFTITNSGQGQLILTSLATSGGNAADFIVNTTGTLMTLPPSASTSFSVTFIPTSHGVRTSTLRLVNNDVSEGTFLLALSGTGITPSPLTFTQDIYAVNQGATAATLTITRPETDHIATVSVQTTDGVAQTVPPMSPAVSTGATRDYNPLVAASTKLIFAIGESTKTVPLVLLPKTGAQPNRHFTATLIPPLPGTPLGTVVTTQVRILANDTGLPTLTVAVPSATTTDVTARYPYNISGTTGDAFGIDRVEVTLNGGAPMRATLGATTRATSYPWSLGIAPVDGPNTLLVTTFDLRGNTTSVTRNFNFTALAPLAPDISVEYPTGVANTILTGGPKDLGAVNLGSVGSFTFTVRNTGTSNLTLTGAPTVALSGPDASLFTISTQPTAGAIGVNMSKTFIVRFAPTTGGVKNAILNIPSDDADEGTYVVNLTATGNNTPPTITSNKAGASAVITMAENLSAVTTVTATDAQVPALQALAFAKSGADADKFNLNPTTGALSFVVPPNYEAPVDANGDNVYQVTVIATDNATPTAGVDMQDLSVTITNVNEAPTISEIADQSILEDGSTGALAFTIADQDAGANLTLTATSSNAMLVPLTRIVLGGSGGERTVTVTPAANLSGSAIITLTVSDGVLKRTEAFTVAVAPVNDMPLFTKGTDRPHPTATATAQTVPAWATKIAAGGGETQTLAFNVTNNNPGMFTVAPALLPNGTLSYTPNGTSGSATVSVTLTDDATAGGPALTTPPQTFTITVSAPPGGLQLSYDLQKVAVEGAADAIVYGARSFDRSGMTVLAADMNGDRIDDLIVSAPFATGVIPGGAIYERAGTVSIWLGKGAFAGTRDAAGIVGTRPDLVIVGAGNDDSIEAVDTGNVDTERGSELLIISRNADVPGARAGTGAAYVVSWDRAMQFATNQVLSLGMHPSQDLVAAVMIYGGTENYLRSEAALGDVNGDQLEDIILTADGSQSCLYVILARPFSSNWVIDLNKASDPNSDDSERLAARPDVVLLGRDTEFIEEGGVLVEDVNGDGIKDILAS